MAQYEYGVSYALPPVPFGALGLVTVELVLCSGAVLTATAKRASCTVYGPSQFLEAFAA